MSIYKSLLTLFVFALCTTFLLVVADKSDARAPHLRQWKRVAQCESGQRWRLNSGNGFYGGLQFDHGTWRKYAMRGRRSIHYRDAHLAPRWIQIRVAERLRHERGMSPWPYCGGRFW